MSIMPLTQEQQDDLEAKVIQGTGFDPIANRRHLYEPAYSLEVEMSSDEYGGIGFNVNADGSVFWYVHSGGTDREHIAKYKELEKHTDYVSAFKALLEILEAWKPEPVDDE